MEMNIAQPCAVDPADPVHRVVNPREFNSARLACMFTRGRSIPAWCIRRNKARAGRFSCTSNRVRQEPLLKRAGKAVEIAATSMLASVTSGHRSHCTDRDHSCRISAACHERSRQPAGRQTVALQITVRALDSGGTTPARDIWRKRFSLKTSAHVSLSKFRSHAAATVICTASFEAFVWAGAGGASDESANIEFLILNEEQRVEFCQRTVRARLCFLLSVAQPGGQFRSPAYHESAREVLFGLSQCRRRQEQTK